MILSEEGRNKALAKLEEAESKHHVRFLWAGARIVTNSARQPRIDIFGMYRRQPKEYVGLSGPPTSTSGYVTGGGHIRTGLNTIDARSLFVHMDGNDPSPFLALYPDEVLINDATFPRLAEEMRALMPQLAKNKGRFAPHGYIGASRTSEWEAESTPVLLARDLVKQRLLASGEMAENRVRVTWRDLDAYIDSAMAIMAEHTTVTFRPSWQTRQILQRIAADTATMLTIGREHTFPSFDQWSERRHRGVLPDGPKVLRPLFELGRRKFEFDLGEAKPLIHALRSIYSWNDGPTDRIQRWEATTRQPTSDNHESRLASGQINKLALEVLGAPLEQIPPLRELARSSYIPQPAEDEESEGYLL